MSRRAHAIVTTQVILAVALFATVSATGSAAAAQLRSCGSISGYEIRVDPMTTTCGLAHSATRDFMRRLGLGDGLPYSIDGRSPKTGRLYRLTLRRHVSRRTWNASTYTGRAGSARLLVQITARLY